MENDNSNDSTRSELYLPELAASTYSLIQEFEEYLFNFTLKQDFDEYFKRLEIPAPVYKDACTQTESL